MGKILIVDDEPDMVWAIKARIESDGHIVLTAANGKQALEILQKENPDLIVTDVVMSEMDGFQLCKELKRNPKTAKIPVLVLTARGKMEDTFRVIGVDEFIAKPFEADELMRKLKKFLDHKEVASVNPGLKILVAGSDRDIVSKMRRLLSKSGFVIETALEGQEIIAKGVSFEPRLVLLDVLMNNLPSSETVKALRRLPNWEKIPIVLYSFLHRDLGVDVQQENLRIGSARSKCLQAGTAVDIGEFNEQNFVKTVAKFIES